MTCTKLWVTCALLAGCAAKPGPIQYLDRGDAALRNHDYAEAEKNYSTAQNFGFDWAFAEGQAGRMKSRIGQLRDELPYLTAMSPTLENVREIRKRIALLRQNGGDAELEATLNETIDNLLVKWSSAAQGDASAFDALQLQAYATGAAAKSALQTVLGRAAAFHTERAAALGNRKLAAQAHRTLASWFSNQKPAYDLALTKEFEFAADVTVSGKDCPQLTNQLFRSTVGASRTIPVAVVISECDVKTSNETKKDNVKWEEQKFVRMDKSPVTQKICGYRDVAVPAPGYDCTSYADRTSCSSATSSISVYMCDEVTTTVEHPVYETVHHEGERETTRRSASVSYRGTVNGSSFSYSDGGYEVFAPALGDQAAIHEGTYRDVDQLTSKARYDLLEDVGHAADAVIKVETLAAMDAARKVNGDDAEEAWARAVMLRSGDAGVWSRYGIPADQLRRLVWGSEYYVEGIVPVERVVAFPTFKRPDDDPAPNGNDLDDLEDKRTPSYSRSGYIGLDTSWLSVPAGTSTTEHAAGTTGLRIGLRILGLKKHHGVMLVDEATVLAALGARLSGDADGTFAYRALASYALGIGYRTYGRGGLIVGARGIAERFQAGDAIGQYTAVPAFARLEVPLSFGTVAAEAQGYSLAGDPHWAGELHVAFQSEGWKGGSKYLIFRASRVTTDLEVSAGMTANDVDVMTYSFLFGVGGDK